jgi:hypothetical protein
MNFRRLLAAALATATGAAALALAPVSPAAASLADGNPRFTKTEGGTQFHWSSPVIGRLGGTDVVAVGAMNGTLYAYKADGSRHFATNVGRPIASSPAIGDVDGDGSTEIVVGFGTETPGAGGVVVLNDAGAERCRFNVPARSDSLAGVFNAPVIADVNGDGAGDVVFGAFNDHIYAMNGNCQVFADFDNQDTVWSSPAAADVDGDGQAEVFIGGDATAGGQPHSGGFFRRLDFNGNFTQTWVRTARETFQSGAAIGVINGQLAVVTQTGRDYCQHRDASRCDEARKIWAFEVGGGGDVPGWPQMMPYRTFLSAPALGDVNGDGATDVVAASEDGSIRAYQGNGATIWTQKVENDLTGSPIIVDTNGGGRPEIVISSTPRAYVLDGTNGGIVRRISEGRTGLAHKNAPAAGVLGGSWVVATAGFDPRPGAEAAWLSVYDIPNPTSAPWPQLKKNARRLGADPSDPQPIRCNTGYWLVASDGGIFSFGDAPFHGSTGDIRLNQPIVGKAPTPGRAGYRFVARDGGIFNFGNASFHGSAGGSPLNSPIVGMANTPSGNGYWLVAADGGIFSYGDAGFYGSAGGAPLNQPIVGMAATPTGKGYWLVARDGGIFSYGDAEFYGSTGNLRLNQPIVGMAASPKGNGYWFVASDGGIFSFGPGAEFFGSTGNLRLNRPVVGMRATPSGNGYWFVATDGGIFSFGDAEFCGSTGNLRLNQPIVGMG